MATVTIVILLLQRCPLTCAGQLRAGLGHCRGATRRRRGALLWLDNSADEIERVVNAGIRWRVDLGSLAGCGVKILEICGEVIVQEHCFLADFVDFWISRRRDDSEKVLAMRADIVGSSFRRCSMKCDLWCVD